MGYQNGAIGLVNPDKLLYITDYVQIPASTTIALGIALADYVIRIHYWDFLSITTTLNVFIQDDTIRLLTFNKIISFWWVSDYTSHPLTFVTVGGDIKIVNNVASPVWINYHIWYDHLLST